LTTDEQGSGRWISAILLIAFTAIAVTAAIIAARARPLYVVDLLQRKLHTSAQLPVRLAVLLLAAAVILLHRFGIDAVLGAIAAGVVISLTCQGEYGESVRLKLEAIGFGFFVPIFFIMTGVKFDLQALTGSGAAVARLPLLLLMLLIVRGAPVLLCRRDLPRGDLLPLALLSATGLPLIVAITEVGVETGRMRPENAAALVGAGMASVLLFPALALALRKPSATSVAAFEMPATGASAPVMAGQVEQHVASRPMRSA
jgi:Kef-type K+ transport system membrane component KefB